MFDKILVVCTGNICRSPMGERLLKKYLPDKTISSAGVQALTGQGADGVAIEVAFTQQLSLEGHSARQLTQKLCQDYDLILVMEKRHVDEVCKIAPEARGKVMLFGHWVSKEIPDPYKKSREAFQYVYQLLEDAAQKWAQALNR
ncbi:protein tyrosine phosphatase [Sodalis sp. RH20]|uniref:arsenate reductase/protein-tyrosine-phosphatase family protein n=1 Tax=unclassified Sodalis (in: enterobacteria) TaxID=2636512 RepID=UPI0039B47126